MERNDLRDLEHALGIRSPWTIKSVSVNEQEKVFDIELDLHDKKRLFGLFGTSKKEATEELVSGRWRYMNLGTYSCMISAQVPQSALSDTTFLSKDLIGQQSFVGHPSRYYSNFLRQQVALGQIKGVDSSVVSDLYGINDTTLKAIKDDLEKASATARALAYLPTEIDKAWDRILNDQLIVRTSVLPLKFLLSKLKLAAAKTDDADELLGLKLQLRQFFIENSGQLDGEIEQVCGITTEKLQQRARAVKSRQRLVLPALKSVVWIELLSGKLGLNSQSIPFNLLISRQRAAFVQGRTKEQKIQAIETIREYFRKNYRTLKPELILLNRAMDIRQKTGSSLPDVEHRVWQRILEDDAFVPSEHIAYKLLLARLRAQVIKQPEPVIKLEAARRIREFLNYNQKAMRQEVGVLLKQVAIV
ncbi:hypothetical protein [Teredinibacter haidensis]|uniref:hypothetical protein n=1 Tax=Teredinibacter haidensis TaxID=2731755 RepID=UPI000948ECF4|nr:hypothetical protein [Teredinibacter haidensis]